MIPTENEDESIMPFKDEDGDHGDESGSLEAMSANQQKEKRSSSGVRMKGYKPSLGVASSKTTKPGKVSVYNESSVPEEQDISRLVNKSVRKKQRMQTPKIEKTDDNVDMYLRESSGIEMEGKRYLVRIISVEPSNLSVTKVRSFVDVICHGSCDLETKRKAYAMCARLTELNYILMDIPPEIQIEAKEEQFLFKKVPMWYLPLVGACCLATNFCQEKVKSNMSTLVEVAKVIKELRNSLNGHPKSD